MAHVPGLLIVEGNADRLRREGATRQIDRLERSLAGLVAKGQLRVKRIKIRNDLDLNFARTFAPYGRYDAVLLVAHGNTEGAEATATTSLTWEQVAEMIAPVAPRALLAISCMAASACPTKALFDGIPSLVAIGGSPAMLSIKQGELAFVELLFAAFGLLLPSAWSVIGSIFNAGETGGVVVWRHRETFEQASAEELLELDVLAVIAKMILEVDRRSRRPQMPRRPPSRFVPRNRFGGRPAAW